MSGEECSLSTLSLNSLNLSDNDLLNKDCNNGEDSDHEDEEVSQNPKRESSIGLKSFKKDDISIENATNSFADGSKVLDSISTINSNIYLPKNNYKKINQNDPANKYARVTTNNLNGNHQSPFNHSNASFNNHPSFIFNHQLSIPHDDPSPHFDHPSDLPLPQSPIHPGTLYSNHHLNEWVSLNVGGRVFTTTKMTLIAQEPESMLARMFDSEWNHWRDEGGAILIDRSPEYFEPILNYLRTGEIIINDTVNIKGVIFEAKFYGLNSMVEELTEMMTTKMKIKAAGDDDDAPISRREFLKLIIGTPSNSELRCQGINLGGTDLSKLDLRSINFKFANLSGCNLSFTNLSYCNFERADLSHSTLDHSTMLGCRMLCTNLESASMKACNFQDAGETHTCLQGANMKRVDLEGSRMAAINLRVANLKNSNLQNCDLRGAILAGTDLENCNLSGCDLQDANLRGANLKGAAFELMLNPLHMSQAVR